MFFWLSRILRMLWRRRVMLLCHMYLLLWIVMGLRLFQVLLLIIVLLLRIIMLLLCNIMLLLGIIMLLLLLLLLIVVLLLWIIMLMSNLVWLRSRILRRIWRVINRVVWVGHRRCFRRPVSRLRRMADRCAGRMGIGSRWIRPASLRIIWMAACCIHSDRGRLTMIQRGELCLVRTGLMQMIVLFRGSHYVSFL